MALDRWIALVLLGVFLVYGYAAWFTMDDLLPPILRRNPVWPSSFPKVLAVVGIVISIIVLLGLEKPAKDDDLPKSGDIDYRRLTDYNLGQALALLGLMVAYALLLRPMGFLAATVSFLFIGSALLGERRWIQMFVISSIAAGFVWYLVQEVLGIFLRPLPFFLG